MTDAVQPSTPETATARLTELSSSPEFRSKIDALDPTAFSTFQSLTKTIAGGTAAVAEATSVANDAKMTADFLAGPLPAGWPDLQSPAGAELAQYLKGEKTISPELRQEVQKKLDEMTADASWRERFFAKDQVALREWQLSTNLLAAKVAP